MTKRLVSHSVYAKTLGVNQKTIYQATRGYNLEDAVVGSCIDVDHPSSKTYVSKVLKRRGLDCNIDPFASQFNTQPEPESQSEPEPESQPEPDPEPESQSEPERKFEFKINSESESEPVKKQIPSRTAGREKKKANSDADGDGVNAVPEHLEAYADMPLRKLIMKFGTDVRFVDWLSALQKLESISEKRLKNEEKRDTLISRELVESYIISEFNECHAKIMTDGVKSIVNIVISKHASDVTDREIERSVSDTIGTYVEKAKKKIKKALKKRRVD